MGALVQAREPSAGDVKARKLSFIGNLRESSYNVFSIRIIPAGTFGYATDGVGGGGVGLLELCRSTLSRAEILRRIAFFYDLALTEPRMLASPTSPSEIRILTSFAFFKFRRCAETTQRYLLIVSFEEP